MSDSVDIKNWEHYEKLSRTTFLKKLHDNLIYAAIDGNIVGVKYLVTSGADYNDLALLCAADNVHLVKYYNDVALSAAAEYGHLDIVAYLISVGADIHSFEDIALTIAAEAGHLEVVKYLVTAGADIHVRDDYALRVAAEEGHLEVVEYLKTLT